MSTGHNDRRWALGVFVASLLILALFSWDRLLSPSPHFHFVDLASSFLDGRLDTDTPRKTFKAVADDPDAPPGYVEAVERATSGPEGQRQGWNDWASYRILTLKDGQELRGVFPWKDQKDDRRHEFHSLKGETYHVECAREVKSGCYGNKAEHVRFYVSFPPFPAVVMTPLVAIWDYAVNDVWVTLVFAAFNAALLFLLLQFLVRRGHSDRSREDNLWLTVLFIFGTVYLFSAIRGEVWFTALIMGVTLHLGALFFLVDLRRNLLVGGLLVGLAMATRTPLVFLCVLPVLHVLWTDDGFRKSDWAGAFGKAIQLGVPVALLLGVLLWYNAVRWDNPLEFGHTYLVEGMRDSIRRHGLMSSWFFGGNLSAAFLNPPVLTWEGGTPLRITHHGLGLLWTTPVLCLLVASPNRTPLFKKLLVAALVVALPGLFYQNTGWQQFGYRFGLDWLPLLVVAFAVGGRPLTWRVKTLILVGVAVNVFGAITFGRMAHFYY